MVYENKDCVVRVNLQIGKIISVITTQMIYNGTLISLDLLIYEDRLEHDYA